MDIKKCACGKRMGRNDTQCKACYKKASDDRYAEADKVVATGVCPTCGAALRRNNALTGWWVCGASGEPSFRLPEYRDRPVGCTFQIFTRQ